MVGSAVGADTNLLALKLTMKSEYRQAVEPVIAQEKKLVEVTKLNADAAAREKQFSKALQLNQETLARYEARVSEIELQMTGKSEPKV